MSASIPCVPCCSTTQVVNIPGIQGAPGATGLNGVSAFGYTTADFNVPASVGSSVTVAVTNSSWAVVGEVVIIGQGIGAAITNPGPATFQITSIPSFSSLTLKFLGYPGDVAVNTPIGSGTGSGGALVSPASQGFASPVAIANGGTGQTQAAAAARALTARRRLLCSLLNANMNTTADQPFTAMAAAKYIISDVIFTNASMSMTTAAGGIYSGAGKTGTVIIPAVTSYTGLTSAPKFKSATLDATAGGPTTDALSFTQLYFSLTSGQGAPGSTDIYIFGLDLS
jgi:hypothetical protein